MPSSSSLHQMTPWSNYDTLWALTHWFSSCPEREALRSLSSLYPGRGEHLILSVCASRQHLSPARAGRRTPGPAALWEDGWAQVKVLGKEKQWRWGRTVQQQRAQKEASRGRETGYAQHSNIWGKQKTSARHWNNLALEEGRREGGSTEANLGRQLEAEWRG